MFFTARPLLFCRGSFSEVDPSPPSHGPRAHLVLARDALDLAAELTQYARDLLHRDFRAPLADAGRS